MKIMNVYISYILSGALIFAPSSYSVAQTTTAPAGAGKAADFCANGPAITDGATITPELSTTGGASGPERNQSGKVLVEACTTLRGAADYLKKNISTFRANGVTGDNFDQIKKGYDEYEKSKKGCTDGHAGASTMCMEDTSPELAGGAADVNNMLGQMGTGANDSCSQAGQAMDMAKKALTAFTGACGGAKMNCTNNCDAAARGAAKLKEQADIGYSGASCLKQTEACDSDLKNYKAALQQAITAGMQEANEGELKSVAGKSQNCNKDMGKALTSALGGIMGMVSGMMQANKCEEETAGEEKKPQDVATADKCLLAENATLPECICLKNPRTVGCSNNFDKGAQSSGGQLATGLTDGANVNRDTASTTLPNGGPGGIEQSPLNNTGDAGGVGAPTGGGPGIGGGGGGSGGAGAPTEGGGPRKTLNTNILGGTGGGGGSFRPGAGAGAGDGEYRAYLPGGAKDPSKGLSGQTGVREVTGQGGKSNWEKVKERYIDNRNSLISN